MKLTFCALVVLLACLVGSGSAAGFRKEPKFNAQFEERFDLLAAWLSYRLSLKHAQETCLARHSLSEERGVQVVKLQVANPTNNEKCYLNCMLEELHFFDNGAIKREGMREALQEIVGEKRLEEIVKGCEKEKSDSVCDTVYKFHVCSAPEFEKVRDDIFKSD